MKNNRGLKTEPRQTPLLTDNNGEILNLSQHVVSTDKEKTQSNLEDFLKFHKLQESWEGNKYFGSQTKHQLVCLTG